MNLSIDFPRPLSDLQASELWAVVEKLKTHPKVETILLFGSFARGDFRVNDPIFRDYPPEKLVPKGSTRPRSDFDLLVLIAEKSPEDAAEIRDFVRDLSETMFTPLDMQVVEFKYINDKHLNADPFIKDVFKNVIYLYHTGKFILEKRHKLSEEGRKKLAQEEFVIYLRKAREFYDGFEFHYNKKHFGLASFNLHQVVEHLLQMTQRVFVCKRPKTHNLSYLRREAIVLAPEIAAFFPQETIGQRLDLKYLSDAYVGGRYLLEDIFPVIAEQLERWKVQVDLLFELSEKVCRERLDQELNDDRD
jgi:predicted nucleotidyltransferase/HEPN domain-containing protein